ncbi:MAG: hypothetical protein A2269_09030 [Lentisphaerae bacterium RIFOXYA12_FULL_60_10]|nr:MAG: hypothetical protein A2269_09030 [Lentisphaerae bacterium RIFOXYA12_FULL_60_10]
MIHDNPLTQPQPVSFRPAGILQGLKLFTVLLVVGSASRTMAVSLVEDGKPLARIYVNLPAPTQTLTSAQQTLQTAIDDLNYHLEKMSGTTLEIVRTADAKSIQKPAIVLDQLALSAGATTTKTSESKEGFRLLTRDGNLWIGGESPQGTALGIYATLRRLGCDWVMPGTIGEIIPAIRTITLPDLDESQTPDFLIRRLWYRGYRTKEHPEQPGERARFEQWLRRQMGGNFQHVTSGTGGHVWDAFTKKHKAEFEKDPTMLALVRMPDNTLVRRGPQLESTHPRVIELFVEDIRATYKKNIEAGTWTRETPAGFGIGPADGLGYSLSPESLKAGSGVIDPIVGELDRTDELILLANRILEKIHPDYPNAHVGFYSYSTHAGYPVKYVPNPKIAQIFAPINFSRFHSVVDPLSKTQAVYKRVVEQWGALSRKQGNPLTYRGYSWNLADNILPYTKVRIWGEELPFYKQHNLIGMNVEGTKMWSVLAPSDYVFMRLCWNSTLDWKDLLNDFCRKAYGKGAPAMERYHLALADRQREARQEAGSFNAFYLMYDDAWVNEAAKTVAEARSAADTEPDRQRISFTTHNVESLRRYLAYHRATMAFDFPAVKTTYDAMASHWQTAYDQNSDMVANEGPSYLKRYLLKFVDGGLLYSTAPYAMVHRLPDAMPTAFDADEVGHLKHYHETAFDDSAWVTSRTYTTTWDAQGLTDGHRSGAVWYRHRFTLPGSGENKGIGLFMGGFEDEARIWLNGQLIGTSGRRFSNPAEYDLTAAFLSDRENLLAIQIVRNSAANEIGLGGILRPCFIFTGPRLEKQAPGPSLELKRVLPGGETADP